jgi:hypothetical protein
MSNLVGTSIFGAPVYREGYVPKAVVAHSGLLQWRNAKADAEDYWLRSLIARYLELFYVKRLEGHPSAETLPIIAESWVEDIGYNLTEEIDADRVQRGVALLSRSIRKWPQPCELIKAMPGRITSPAPAATTIEPEVDHDLASESLDAILESLG